MTGLEQLQATLPPTPPAFWPPAPGWWLLLLLAPLCGWLLYLLRRWQRQRRQPVATADTLLDPQRQAALEALAALPRPYDQPAGPWLQQLNTLLKRLARAHYPEANSHVLSGRDWLAFLDSRCPSAGLTRWMVLVDGGYRAHCRLDDRAIDELQQAVATWIRAHV